MCEKRNVKITAGITFMSMGRLLVSLLRYKILGYDEEIKDYWKFEPTPEETEWRMSYR